MSTKNTANDTKKVSFVQFERRILLDLVRRHHDIVQDRRTDSTSVYRKQQIWQQITETYNQHPSIARPREVQQLKRLWQNTRARAKQAGVGRVSAISAAAQPNTTTATSRNQPQSQSQRRKDASTDDDDEEEEDEEDDEEEDSVDSIEQPTVGHHADDMRYINKCMNPTSKCHKLVQNAI